MEMNEIIEKIGKEKLKEALKSGDSKAVQALIEESGLELDEEQLEYLAGGHGWGPNNELTDDDFVNNRCSSGRGGNSIWSNL